MKNRIVLLGLIILSISPTSLFAQGKKGKKDSPIDFNLQVGANTTLSSVTDYAVNMKKLADGAIALDKANKSSGGLTGYANAGRDLDKVLQGYNGAAAALSTTLANLRFGAGFQLGFKPVNRSAVILALGVGSGLRMGALENVVNAAQGSLVFFDVPVHAYIALELFSFLRFDGLIGMVFSASSQNLADFTARPLEGASKGKQLLNDAFNAPKFDLVLRTSLSMFYLELNGAINLTNPKDLSFFRLGLGVNINIL